MWEDFPPNFMVNATNTYSDEYPLQRGESWIQNIVKKPTTELVCGVGASNLF